MEPDKTVFEAKNIVKRFGRTTVLKGINLKINAGDFITLFGANGAGKTTFLRISSMLLSSTEGEIFYKNKNIKEAGNEARKNIGFIAHNTFLYNNLSARENLRFYGKMFNMDNHETKLENIIEGKLKAVGLFERADDLVHGFSRGMMQRLTIARAFLHDPAVMFFDEPYTGLDRGASEILNNLIRSFYGSNNAGIMTTHNLEQGYDIATHVAIMNKGKIEFMAPTTEISKIDFAGKYMELVG